MKRILYLLTCGALAFGVGVAGAYFTARAEVADSVIRAGSVAALAALPFDGLACGGLSVGEPAGEMYGITELCTAILPEEKPRYLMGVGTPENILESVERGVDMFDCVMPTRNARNGVLFTSSGRLNMRNARHTDDFAPVDAQCSCYTCRTFTRAYLRHLFKAGEILALQLATIHNITFYLTLMKGVRDAIAVGRFAAFKAATLENARNSVREPGIARFDFIQQADDPTRL